jgi:hypothetical protein
MENKRNILGVLSLVFHLLGVVPWIIIQFPDIVKIINNPNILGVDFIVNPIGLILATIGLIKGESKAICITGMISNTLCAFSIFWVPLLLSLLFGKEMI